MTTLAATAAAELVVDIAVVVGSGSDNSGT